MRMALLLTFLAGCVFQPGHQSAGSGSGGGSDAGTGSGSGTGVDSGSGSGSACSDIDHDGLCDDVDPWPCAAAAPTITSNPKWGDFTEGANITHVKVDGAGQLAVARAGDPVTVAFDFGWAVDCGLCQGFGGPPQPCPCQAAQLEIGFVIGTREGCAWDGPTQHIASNLSGNASLVAPAPGVYDIRVNIGKQTSCAATTTWSGGEPSASHAIAKVCVY